MPFLEDYHRAIMAGDTHEKAQAKASALNPLPMGLDRTHVVDEHGQPTTIAAMVRVLVRDELAKIMTEQH
jgi:hypothetical protein